MNLEPFVDYLADNGVGIKGTTLFGYSLPADVKTGVAVISNATITREPYQKGRRDGTIQVIVRGTSYDDIEKRAESVSTLLDAQGLVLGSIKILKIYPLHEPLIYPRSEGSLLEASVNFNITYVN